jgi:hypothetical protein
MQKADEGKEGGRNERKDKAEKEVNLKRDAVCVYTYAVERSVVQVRQRHLAAHQRGRQEHQNKT